MSQEAGPAAAGRLNGATTWAKNREKPKPADSAPSSRRRHHALRVTQTRHIERRTEMPPCQASPSEASKAQQQALGVLPERGAGRRHSPANPERPRAGSESEAGIPAASSRTPTRGSGGPQSRGCFSASRARRGSRPFYPRLCACARPAAGGRGVRCSLPPRCRADAWAATRATMTDYGEEQRNELEALESIYPDSFTGDFGGRPRWGGGRGPAALPPSLRSGSSTRLLPSPVS